MNKVMICIMYVFQKCIHLELTVHIPLLLSIFGHL